jgi:hypothetical protein
MKLMNHSFFTDLHFAIDLNFDNRYIRLQRTWVGNILRISQSIQGVWSTHRIREFSHKPNHINWYQNEINWSISYTNRRSVSKSLVCLPTLKENVYVKGGLNYCKHASINAGLNMKPVICPIAALTTFSFSLNFMHRFKFSESHGNDGRCFHSFTCSFSHHILLLLPITSCWNLKTEYRNQLIFSSAALSFRQVIWIYYLKGYWHTAWCSLHNYISTIR